jgi:hypothetical protein
MVFSCYLFQFSHRLSCLYGHFADVWLPISTYAIAHVTLSAWVFSSMVYIKTVAFLRHFIISMGANLRLLFLLENGRPPSPLSLCSLSLPPLNDYFDVSDCHMHTLPSNFRVHTYTCR